MNLRAELPPDREAEGRFTVTDSDGRVVLGPVRCRGEADDAEERKHGTADDNPLGVFGDHPFGQYRVTAIEQAKQPARTYGPYFVRLFPLSGEAKQAWDNGRRGLGIHGGDLGPRSTLRPTFGCLRCDNETMEQLARLLTAEFITGRPILYDCVPLP